MDDEDEHDDRMVRRVEFPVSHQLGREPAPVALFSSGAQRPRPPGAGISSGPPGKTPRAHAPPRRELLRVSPLQDDQHHEDEHSDGQLQ
eukprot:5118461-Pyramimonas_sp.AAC.1